MKNFIKVIIFLIIGAIIFQILTLIFIPKWKGKIDPATPRIKGYYKEKEDTIDVLAIRSK